MTTIPRPNEILLAVEQATGVPTTAILADNRLLRTSYARFLAMLLYKETHAWVSNHDVAQIVGKKDPSTGRHGLMRAEYLLANDAEFRQAHAKARQELGLEPAGVTG